MTFTPGTKCNALILFVAAALLLVPLSGSAAETKQPETTVVAYYFITNVRCPSCMTIERLTKETITDRFADELTSGRLQFQVLNIDEPGNFHYVKDYSLYTKSVILSEFREGQEIRWKNLPRVWEFLKNEDKFRQYVIDSVTSFLAGQ